MPFQFDSHVRDFVTWQQVKRCLRYPHTFRMQTREQTAMAERMGLRI